MAHKGFGTDADGNRFSKHICDTCGNLFTVTPAVEPDNANFDNCLDDECPSFDPERDADVLYMTDAEIAREKPIVSLSKLRERAEKATE